MSAGARKRGHNDDEAGTDEVESARAAQRRRLEQSQRQIDRSTASLAENATILDPAGTRFDTLVSKRQAQLDASPERRAQKKKQEALQKRKALTDTAALLRQAIRR